jgi:hypothetical protein
MRVEVRLTPTPMVKAHPKFGRDYSARNKPGLAAGNRVEIPCLPEGHLPLQ